MKRRLVSLIQVLTVCSIFIGLVFHSLTVHAQFNANDLMDEQQFDNSGTMNAAQIDTFLNNNFGSSSCISTSHGFTSPDVIGYSPSTGFQFGTDVSAGTIIYHAAQVYGLNPQVILTNLEKEQSLLSGGAGCSTLRYTAAMGNGCPDSVNPYNYSGFELYSINGNPITSVTGTCVNGAGKAGFSKQVVSGAWLLKFSEQRAVGNVGWNIHVTNFPYQGNVWDNSDDPGTHYYGYMTQGNWATVNGGSTFYHDGTAPIDGTTVYISDGATAALYTYTPHFHGNESFDDIFNTWFGLSVGEGYTLVTSYDDNGDRRQWVVYQGVRHWIPDAQTLNAWGLNKITLVQWSGTYLGSFPTGPNLTRLMRPNGSQDVYFVDGGNCYKVTSSAMLAAWNFNPAAIVDVSTYLGRVPTNAGDLTYSAQQAGSLYVVDGGKLRQYSNPNVFAAWEGDSAGYTNISTDYFNEMGGADPGGIAPITSEQITGGSQLYEVVSGQKLPESSSMSQLYPGGVISVSPATINRLISSSPASQFVKTKESNIVYMVDNSTKYQVANPDILTAWDDGSNPLVNTVDQGNMNLLTNGPLLNTYEADVGGQLYIMDGRKIAVPTSIDGAYRTSSNVFSPSSTLISLAPNGVTANAFVKAINSPAVYLMDSGTLHQILSPNDLKLWSNGDPITTLSNNVLSQFASNTPVGAYVTDGTSNFLMEGGQKHVMSTQQSTNWNLNNPVALSSTLLSAYTTGASIPNQLQDSLGRYYYVTQGTAYMTTDPNIAGEWGIGGNAKVVVTELINQYLQLGMMTRFAQSNIPNDNRLFVLDNGVLYYLLPLQAANLGLIAGSPMASVNPSAITPSITNWNSILVQDASGKEYVIDGGTKRYFPSTTVQSLWTNDGAVNATSVTNGFLNLLPTSGYIERGVKDATPPVYDIQGAVKHWIQSPSGAASYAPILTVSNALVDVLQSGPNL